MISPNIMADGALVVMNTMHPVWLAIRKPVNDFPGLQFMFQCLKQFCCYLMGNNYSLHSP